MLDVEMQGSFLAFSKAVPVDRNSLFVLGGLDDTVPNKPNFSNRVIQVKDLPLSNYENALIGRERNPMLVRRGC